MQFGRHPRFLSLSLKELASGLDLLCRRSWVFRYKSPLTGKERYMGLGPAPAANTDKIREGLARDDYRDPGAYQHPPGTVAYEVDAPATEPARQEGPATAKPPANDKPGKPAQMKGMKM